MRFCLDDNHLVVFYEVSASAIWVQNVVEGAMCADGLPWIKFILLASPTAFRAILARSYDLSGCNDLGPLRHLVIFIKLLLVHVESLAVRSSKAIGQAVAEVGSLYQRVVLLAGKALIDSQTVCTPRHARLADTFPVFIVTIGAGRSSHDTQLILSSFKGLTLLALLDHAVIGHVRLPPRIKVPESSMRVAPVVISELVSENGREDVAMVAFREVIFLR